jgi:hypothetical protein
VFNRGAPSISGLVELRTAIAYELVTNRRESCTQPILNQITRKACPQRALSFHIVIAQQSVAMIAELCRVAARCYHRSA